MTFTASSYGRAKGCPGSFALPQANTQGVWSGDGIDKHESVAEVIEAHRSGRETTFDAYASSVMDIIPDSLVPHLRAEVSFAINVATGEARELGQYLNRSYRLDPFEVAGTADMVATLPDRVVVLDLKTGHGEVAPAVRNAQLQLLGLAAARTAGRGLAQVGLVLAPDGKTPRIDWHELEQWDLDEVQEELRQVYAAVAKQVSVAQAGGVPNVAEGAHCKYCPAVPYCPAKTALIRRLANGAEADELELLKPMTPATAGMAYSRLQYAKQLLRHIEQAVFGALEQFGELELPNGRLLRKVVAEGNEKLDGDTVWQVLSDYGGRELADKAVERTATKKRIGQVMREAYGREGADRERQVLAEVRSRGGARRGTTEKIVEVDK